MDRNDLTLAVAGALAGAFLLGWILRWIFGRMNASGGISAEAASRLHAADEARQEAEKLRDDIERVAAHRIADLQDELADSREALAKARQDADAERAASREATGGQEPG